jgi:hypothetical protein
MHWPTRITLGILGFIVLAACYLAVRHHRREAIPASGSIQLESNAHNRKNSSTLFDGVHTPQQRKSLSATIPFGKPNPNSGDLSNISTEERTVRAALQMIGNGEFKNARQLLTATIMTTRRGHNYIRYDRPNRISIRKDRTLIGNDQIQFETWIYENHQGEVYRELEFEIKPTDGQTGDLDPAHPNAGASAFWTYAYSFYDEGGLENAQKAKTTFQDFLALFANGPDDLVQAAQINIAVIDINLMQSAPTLGYRIAAAREAVQVLKNFFSRWPNYPRAYDVSIALENAQNFLANPR